MRKINDSAGIKQTSHLISWKTFIPFLSLTLVKEITLVALKPLDVNMLTIKMYSRGNFSLLTALNIQFIFTAKSRWVQELYQRHDKS